MKAPNELSSNQPVTIADIKDRLEKLVAKIDAKQTEVVELRDAIPRLISEHVGSDLAAIRERKRLTELNDEVRHLLTAQAVLQQTLRDAEQKQFDESWSKEVRQSELLAAELKAAASNLENHIDKLVVLALKVQALDQQFCASLRRKNSDFDVHAFSIQLARLIALRIFAKSDGHIRPERTFETPYDLLQSGRVDLTQRAADYITVALRGSKVAPLIHPEPPHAA